MAATLRRMVEKGELLLAGTTSGDLDLRTFADGGNARESFVSGNVTAPNLAAAAVTRKPQGSE